MIAALSSVQLKLPVSSIATFIRIKMDYGASHSSDKHLHYHCIILRLPVVVFVVVVVGRVAITVSIDVARQFSHSPISSLDIWRKS